jgi:hypothetical protein
MNQASKLEPHLILTSLYSSEAKEYLKTKSWVWPDVHENWISRTAASTNSVSGSTYTWRGPYPGPLNLLVLLGDRFGPKNDQIHSREVSIDSIFLDIYGHSNLMAQTFHVNHIPRAEHDPRCHPDRRVAV